MRATVIGVSGYTGQVLLKLLTNHPRIDSIIPVSTSLDGLEVEKEFKLFAENRFCLTDGKIINLAAAQRIQTDVVFSCLPHLTSAKVCEPFFGKCVVIDLSADFRIDDNRTFQRAYKSQIPREDLIKQACYGLCEWNLSQIKKSNIIAVPGCYPTATLLPILPFTKHSLIESCFVVNALSGVSGAGKKLAEDLLYCQRAENAHAYLPGKQHRHLPEMEYQIQKITDFASDIIFTPHIVPQKQGMFVSTVATLLKQMKKSEIYQILTDTYKECPFVRIEDDIPQTQNLLFSNRCDISFCLEGDKLLLFSAIDNLYKGASGNAVQNMNIRFGFSQSCGLV